MDSLVTMIVDLLRNKEETAALNKGGPLAGSPDAALQARSSASMLAPPPADAALQQRSGASLLGSGAARGAADKIDSRRAVIEKALADAGA